MKVLITSEELAEVLDIKPYLARRLIRGSQEMARQKGLIILNTRPISAPYEIVATYLKKMGIKLKGEALWKSYLQSYR